MWLPQLADLLEIHARVIARTGGASGVLNAGALEVAVQQPRQVFGGEELYPTIEAKASALAFFIGSNHPFVDGNKRVALVALEVTLVQNGLELQMTVDEAEDLFLRLAAGAFADREAFAAEVSLRIVPLGGRSGPRGARR